MPGNTRVGGIEPARGKLRSQARCLDRQITFETYSVVRLATSA